MKSSDGSEIKVVELSYFAKGNVLSKLRRMFETLRTDQATLNARSECNQDQWTKQTCGYVS